MALKMHYCRLL